MNIIASGEKEFNSPAAYAADVCYESHYKY